MVKFAKQLELSLVPEWKDAYCNYKALKRDAKKVREERVARTAQSGGAALMSRSGTLTRTMTRISTLKQTVGSEIKHGGASGRLSLSRGGGQRLKPDDYLVVHRIEADCHGKSQLEQYETELLDPLQESEADRQFFKRLDAQLNKVNRFYKMKEEQYVARAKRLEQQLLTLFQFQEEHARHKETFGPVKAKDHDSDDDQTDDDDDNDEGDDIE